MLFSRLSAGHDRRWGPHRIPSVPRGNYDDSLAITPSRKDHSYNCVGFFAGCIPLGESLAMSAHRRSCAFHLWLARYNTESPTPNRLTSFPTDTTSPASSVPRMGCRGRMIPKRGRVISLNPVGTVRLRTRDPYSVARTAFMCVLVWEMIRAIKKSPSKNWGRRRTQELIVVRRGVGLWDAGLHAGHPQTAFLLMTSGRVLSHLDSGSSPTVDDGCSHFFPQ